MQQVPLSQHNLLQRLKKISKTTTNFSCWKPSALTFCEILCRPFCGNPLHPNTSMHILCIFPFFQQGDFVEKARAPLVGYHFLYSHDLYVWLRGDTVRSNKTLFSLRGHSSLLEVTGLRGQPPAFCFVYQYHFDPWVKRGTIERKISCPTTQNHVSYKDIHLSASSLWS